MIRQNAAMTDTAKTGGLSADPPPLWWTIGSRGVLTCSILLVLYLVSMSWLQLYPRDVQGYVVGRDFLNFWTMGREAFSDDPARFYDWRVYVPHLQSFLGTEYPYQQWSYPPQVMLLAAPFGQLPYVVAYALWTVLGLSALYFAARPWIADRRAAAVLFLSPAALLCFVSGQNAFLTAAALIMIYRWRDERPVMAGLLLGLLTLKPQLGLLFPLVLLLSRRWMLFASAALTALSLLAATALAFGVDMIRAYLEIGAPEQAMVIEDPTKVVQALMPTLYMSLRVLGFSADAGYLVQGVMLIIAAATAGWAFYRRRDPILSYGLLLVATALATPYLMSYDLVVFGWLLLALTMGEHGDCIGEDRYGKVLLTGLYWLPMIALALGMAGIPGAVLVFIATGMWLAAGLAGRWPFSAERSPQARGA